ncbi:hypothetical protein EON63_04735 [archaeon]|nr:MAG: hypothetical protein EON63_04735 [archaeon]
MPDHALEPGSEFEDNFEWPEFFHMPVLMLMLITLLNDGTMIAIGYDNVSARSEPEKWNLKVIADHIPYAMHIQHIS